MNVHLKLQCRQLKNTLSYHFLQVYIYLARKVHHTYLSSGRCLEVVRYHVWVVFAR